MDLDCASNLTEPGIRVFFDDDEESYFDISVERVPDSELSEVQIAPELPMNGGAFDDGVDIIGGGALGWRSSGERRVMLEESVDMLRCISCRDFKILTGSGPAPKAGGDHGMVAGEVRGQKPVTVRKSSKLASVFNNNSVVKFFIKFPSEKIRSAFVSSMKTHRPDDREGDMCTRRRRRLMPPFHKLMHKSKNKVDDRCSGRLSTASSIESIGLQGRSSATRGDSNATLWRPGKTTMNFNGYPGSIVSSPSNDRVVHRGKAVFERDSSVSAAIAHCKLSLYGGAKCER